MSVDEGAALVRGSLFLESLAPETLTRITSGGRTVSFGRGQFLFLEGDEPDAVYLVLSGMVRIFVTELDGTEISVRIAGAGEVLGELAVLDGGVRSAGAAALRAVRAFRVPAGLVAAELPPHGTVGRSALRGLVAVVRENTRRLAIERAPNLEAMLARVLVEDPRILLRMTQGELAGLVGVSRQSLNQILRGWEREGVIGRRDGVMQVQDADALGRRAL